MQELHGLRAVPFQNVALAFARRTFHLTACKNFTDSHHQRAKNCVLKGFRIMREWRSGTTQDCQDATVRSARGMESREQCLGMLQGLQTVDFQRGSSFNRGL
eukprot:1334643-Pyramimonas_sp.AAC.1